jgi:uncharacterized sulfatase
MEHGANLALMRLGTRIGTSRFHDSYVDGLPDSEITLPEALRVAGYATGMVGKWHLGDFSHDTRHLPTRHGFEFFEGIPHSNDEFPVAVWRNEQELTPNVGLDQEDMTADFTRAAIGFIDANRDRPFFLYVAHKDVHVPLFPSDRFRGKSAAGLFGDAVEELDWSVGEILRALDDRGLRDNTLVLFTSDNGAWYEGSTQGLRGRKGMPFEGGQRVPMIASWPGRLPAGAQVDAPSMNIDVFPTLLGRAGLSLPADRVIDGRDLWGVMSGTDTSDPHEALLFFDDKVVDGVRSGPWKYYRHVDRYYWPVPLDKPNTPVGKRVANYTYTDPATNRTVRLVADDPMLYDLRLDSGESYNVADRPRRDRRLLSYIERWEQAFFRTPAVGSEEVSVGSVGSDGFPCKLRADSSDPTDRPLTSIKPTPRDRPAGLAVPLGEALQWAGASASNATRSRPTRSLTPSRATCWATGISSPPHPAGAASRRWGGPKSWIRRIPRPSRAGATMAGSRCRASST